MDKISFELGIGYIGIFIRVSEPACFEAAPAQRVFFPESAPAPEK